MTYVYLFTFASLVGLVSVISYRWSFLHTKKISYLSLMQYFYLIIVPGVLLSFIFSFILDILDRPPNLDLFLNDRILTIALLLSLIYTYAGVVTHAVCKTLSQCFDKSQHRSRAFVVNKYLHLTFSHNLCYAGICSVAIFLSLLEINHLPFSSIRPRSYLLPLINGLILGLTFIFMLIQYRSFSKNKDISEYFEVKPWSDLRFFFYIFWGVFLIFLYGAKPYLRTIQYYPIAFSILIASLEVVVLSFYLYFRRLYRRTRHRFSSPNNQ